MSEFSVCLKNAIELSGYSVYSIAKEIDYDRATLTNQINGKRKMTKDVFMKLLNTLNITEPARLKLIDMFHRDIFESDYVTFETIKESFQNYSKTSFIKGNNLSDSYIEISDLNNMINISGELFIINVLKNIISLELQKNNPTVYFNLDLTRNELLMLIQSLYMNAGDSLDMKNIISFSINETDNVENFTKFIKILPLLLNGYCPYYYFTEHNIESELSLLFPYYLITSEKIILVSINFDQAIILSDKNIIKTYTNEFKIKLSKCKTFKYESAAFFQMPYVFSNCLDPQEKQTIYCFNETFCALPFLSKEHLTYMFSEKFGNHEEIISELRKCYQTIKEFIAFTPIESLMEFIETGNEGHTTNDYSKPLTIEQRIEVLTSIRTFINNGGKYYFVRRADFFCNNLTFNVISDSKIIFFTLGKNADKNSMFTLTTPNGLLRELKYFFESLRKSCYVLSEEESIQALDDGIEYAKSLQES
ncbi:MAG: helix-turn-helix domain-containing protein [Ruminococcus sp.]